MKKKRDYFPALNSEERERERLEDFAMCRN